MRIRVNDTVVVLSGDDKGKRGKVLSVDRAAGKVTVQGVNLVYKHLRKSQQSPQGGRLSREMPIAACKVALVDPATNEPTRLGVRVNENGDKVLYAKASGETIRVLVKGKSN